MTTDLTFVERTTLLVLMAESRPLKLTEIKVLASELSAKSRAKLSESGLIEVQKVGRGTVVELTDKGWVRGSEEFGAEAPTQASRSGGKALYTLLRAMRRYFDRVEIEPNEVFLPADVKTPQPAKDAEPVFADTVPENRATDTSPVAPAENVEIRIRSAYNRLAREPQGWVSLTRLRADLSQIDRAAVDHVLSSLYREQKINLIPEANQKTLTDEDRSAALHIGGQNRHMVTIK